MWINIAGAWVGNAGIYTVSTQYLLSIYSVSTRYLHSSGVHGVSTVPGVETAASVSCAATAGGEGTYTYTVWH